MHAQSLSVEKVDSKQRNKILGRSSCYSLEICWRNFFKKEKESMDRNENFSRGKSLVI